MIGTLRTVATCLLVGGAWFGLAGDAAAAPGGIAYDRCLSNDPAQGCFDLPGVPIDGASGVAVSPDGRSVYVASPGSGSIAHFLRGADGRISYDGCLNNDGSQGCADLPGAPLYVAYGVAVSPDGKSVYVASTGFDSIAHFFRGPDGQLSYDGCLNNDGRQGCGDLPGEPLYGAWAVAVSPDGGSVYVVSLGGNSIAHFVRNGPDGQISYDGCLNNDGTRGCGDVPGAPLTGASGVAVSPDGKSVYVTAVFSSSIAHFFRNRPDGKIFYDGCLNSDGSESCVNVPGSPLDSARGVAVSPDGTSVYVASPGSDSISHLVRNTSNGQLAWDGCLNNDGSQNCLDLPEAPLDTAARVAVSPDGESVYVTSNYGDGIAHLVRSGPDGQLAWAGCLNNDGTEGCGDLPAAPLDGAYGVAVSPDGTSVYVGSQFSSSVAHFVREQGAPQSPPDPALPDAPPRPDAPPASADTLAPSISGLALTNRRFRVGRSPTALAARRARVGTALRYTLSERATVTVAIERARPGRRAGSRCRKPSRSARRGAACIRWASAGGTLRRRGDAGPNSLRFTGRLGSRKLRPGAYRARVSATDAAGNRSITASVRFRIVR